MDVVLDRPVAQPQLARDFSKTASNQEGDLAREDLECWTDRSRRHWNRPFTLLVDKL